MAAAVVAVIAGLGVGLSMIRDRGVPVPVVKGAPERSVAASFATPRWGTFPDLFQAGVKSLREGRPADAERDLVTAVALVPHVPEAYVNLGFARLDLGLWKAAERAFQRAVDLRPGQANAYYGLAMSLEQQKDLAGARGAMLTYLHLTREDDPYRRKAMAALWEWEAKPPSAGRTSERDGSAAPAVHRAGAAAFFDLVLPRIGGGTESMRAFSGRVVVVNFWATWCPPCRAELPSLQRLAGKLGTQRFAVIGISIDTDAGFTGEFLREAGVRYPNYFDSAGRVTRFMRTAGALPLTLLIDAGGRVREQIVGIRDWTAPEMLARIRRLDDADTDDRARAAASGSATVPGGGQ
jgi:thiol-disulfide isomerase/thioredoxin